MLSREYVQEQHKNLINENNQLEAKINYYIKKTQRLEKEKKQLKTILKDIEVLVNKKKQPFNWEFPDSNFWLNANDIDDILDLIHKGVDK